MNPVGVDGAGVARSLRGAFVEMDEKNLGKRLQQARKNAGLTQQAMCQRAGISYSTLAKIERGAIKSPSIFTIGQIAGVLGVSLDELAGAPTNTNVPKKQSKTGIKFVYFDVNGCLVRFYQRAFTRIAEDTGVRSDIVETAFWHYNDAVCRGEISLKQFNSKVAAKLHIDKLDWQQYYLEVIDPITEMHQLVKWATEHYRVGLLTNIMPGLIGAMLEKGFLPKVNYTAIIDSSEVGAIKPEAKIFEIAKQKANVQAKEILLIDDNRANITAAERQGWHVMWFDDYHPKESVKRAEAALEFAD